MYRKDECPSLFKDPEQLEADALQNISDGKPALMWHKVHRFGFILNVVLVISLNVFLLDCFLFLLQILWTILDLDKKWLLLQKRKSALQLYYKKRYAEESRIIDDETRLNFIRQLFDSITKSLKAAVSEREVDDVDSKFNLHFPPGEVGDVNGQYKRPKRRSQYSSCSKAGLWGLVSKLGYSSEQFGLQLSLEKMVGSFCLFSQLWFVASSFIFVTTPVMHFLLENGGAVGQQGNPRRSGFKFYMCYV